jgi:poly(A) polymerase
MSLERTELFRDDTMGRLARGVARRLRRAGHQALFAGGAVRDALLGAAAKDIDIATSATPDEVEALFEQTYAVGKAFGVVVVLEEGMQFEVATFRAEAEYSDGRHPDRITYADAEADASRRDFTVNGLFFDPATDTVLDFVDGQADLRRRVIRAIGDPLQRFGEDRLRLMRAVRFCANLDFEMDAPTCDAVKREARHLQVVSAERIREELVKILTGADPRGGIVLLDECGLLEPILPELGAMKGCTQPPQFHPEGDVWTHTMMMLGSMRERSDDVSAPLALAVLLHDVGKPPTRSVSDRIRFNGHDAQGARMAEQILRRLRCSRGLIRDVVDLVGQHMRFMVVDQMRPSRRERWLRDPLFPLHLELHALDCLASHGGLDKYQFAAEALRALPPVPGPRLLRGGDLLAMGLPEGPDVGRILEAVDDRIAAGELVTREQALQAARILVDKESRTRRNHD